MQLQIKKLSECCLSISDGDHQPPPKQDKGVPFITISNFNQMNEISFENVMYVSEEHYEGLADIKRVQEGDILYSVVGSFGIPILIRKNERFVFQRHIAILRPNRDIVLPEYLYYVLLNPDFYRLAEKYAIGAAQKTISLDSLRNIEIKIHPLEEQKRIVSKLVCIDDKIRNNTAINDNLSAMIDDIYCHTFLRTKHPNTWRIGKLSEVISQINTGLNPRDNFVLGNGNIKYITVKNLTANGTIDFTNCDTVDVTAQSIIHNRSDISVGDILFASIAPLGRCYLINTEPKDWDINESVFSIRPNYQLISSEYLYSYFMSEYFVTKAQSSSTGSIFKGIRIGTLLDMDIVIPPFDIVEQFTNTTKSLFRLKQQCTDEAQQLIKLRNWLLPLLMNGQATIDD